MFIKSGFTLGAVLSPHADNSSIPLHGSSSDCTKKYAEEISSHIEHNDSYFHGFSNASHAHAWTCSL